MDLRRTSKQLSWLLRHGANEAGLPMDGAGWAPVDAVLAHVGLDEADLARIVAENDKQRLQLDGARIRAAQGHSPAGTPVTVDALEASWERVDRAEPAFHGTRIEAVEAIARDGLLPMDRTHVHLAATRDARVGKRADVAVLLVVDPVALAAAGVGLYRSPNGVLLARRVPPGCIVDLEPVSRRARQLAHDLRRRLVPS